MKKYILLSVIIISLVLTGCAKNGVAVQGSELLKDGTIERITVSSLPGGYDYLFTKQSDIQTVVDYVSNLNISQNFEENPNEYSGMTWVIGIYYQDDSKCDIYHFGNMFIRNDEGSWYRMRYEEAEKFAALLDSLK